MKEELISIIIPVYNVQQYLSRCIDSVLRQTYPHFELILVNDGSPDESPQICDDYAKRDGRIKVIHKTNGGLSSARNAGLDIALGAYITFVDSDDWIHEQYLEKLFSMITSHNADIAVANFIMVYDDKPHISDAQIEIKAFSNIESLHYLVGPANVQMTVSWGKLYKNKLFNEIRFPLGKIHEDEFTTYKLLYYSQKTVVTSEVLLYYFQRSNSITGNSFILKNRLHAIEAFEERIRFFENIVEHELVHKTYRTLFGIYKQIIENENAFPTALEKANFNRKFKDFMKRLNKTKQPNNFAIKTKLFAFSPSLYHMIQRILRRK